jgi:hypothetical protein
MTEELSKKIAELYVQYGGIISAIARETNLARSTVRENLAKQGLGKKPLASGTIEGVVEKRAPLPHKGEVKRYILTSAQNNTYVHEEFWDNLKVLAEHYSATIIVGTYSYNQNNFGNLAVKRGTKPERQHELWFDPEIKEYINDSRIELGKGLVWCGEMNILPTAVNPLSGLETYTHRKSAIFPHAKLAMRSIPTMQGEGTKLNYTTGTVTLMNYLQKKEGLKAEHHHRYAALLVEVNHDGNWWVRQLGYSKKENSIQDLDVKVKDCQIIKHCVAEAITFGDLHAGQVDPTVLDLSMDMIDTLKPKCVFLHDVLEGASVSHHDAKNPHAKFSTYLRGFNRLEVELKVSKEVIEKYFRPWLQVVVPDSNHDAAWIARWLREFDYRVDPSNAELFLKLQAYVYDQIRGGKMPRDVNVIEAAFKTVGLHGEYIKFLLADESFQICEGKIECGQHGHLGPSGSRGTPQNLNNMGRRANTAHTHSAGIYNGLYVAGTSSKLRWAYNLGPTSWSHTHTLVYPNGQRTMVTMYNGQWKA